MKPKNTTFIFGVPYAGASEECYSMLAKELAGQVLFIPLPISGRGRRACEPICNSLDKAIRDLHRQLLSKIQQYSFKNGDRIVLFGHSMGAWLAYGLAVKLRENGDNFIAHIFASGIYPPKGLSIEEFRELADADKDVVYKISSKYKLAEKTPPQCLIKHFEKVLKSDFKIMSEFDLQTFIQLDIPITVLYGKNDHYSNPLLLSLWGELTRFPLELCCFKGGHYFINDDVKNVANTISNICYRDI